MFRYVDGDPVNHFDPFGLVTINLMPPASRANLFFSTIVAPNGQTYVLAHGSEKGVYDGRGSERVLLSSTALANLVKQNGWKPGEPVKLVSCNVADSPAYPQALANVLGVPVTASDGYVYAPGNGQAWPSHSSFFPVFSFGAKWITFNPDAE